jgi:tRNA(fMet)-specific endonuclease VapC
MRYLLDTNIVSDLVRHPQGQAAKRVAEFGEDNVCTSIIVAAELRYGATRRASRRLSAQLDAVLGALDILPLELPTDREYGALRAALEATGQVIGPNDMLIAAQAIALGCTLVTHNTRDFTRVARLRLANWLR